MGFDNGISSGHEEEGHWDLSTLAAPVWETHRKVQFLVFLQSLCKSEEAISQSSVCCMLPRSLPGCLDMDPKRDFCTFVTSHVVSLEQRLVFNMSLYNRALCIGH